MCELTRALGANQPHISRHLAQLRELGVVADRREGLWVYYRLNPSLPKWANAVIGDTASGTAATAPFSDDEQALSSMADRPGSARCT